MSSQGNPPPAHDEFSWHPRHYGQVAPPPQNSTAATAALVLGIIGLCLWPIGVVALLLGLQGREDTKKRGMTGGGQAVAGIILGSITSLATLISIIVFLAGVLG